MRLQAIQDGARHNKAILDGEFLMWKKNMMKRRKGLKRTIMKTRM